MPEEIHRIGSFRSRFGGGVVIEPAPTTEAPRTGCDEHPHPDDELVACRNDYLHFLRYWKFKNRETGDVLSFANLWEGQREAAEQMVEHRRLLLLKAGKLGFTELEAAFDGWRLRFGHANIRVHLFSLDSKEAKKLLGYVRFGLLNMPAWMQLPLLTGPGGDTTEQLTLIDGSYDERVVASYPATPDAAIADSASHSHVDELARMPWPEATWSSVESTVTPGGTAHIVSRGMGDQNYLAVLWEQAQVGEGTLVGYFAPYWKRPRHPEKLEVPAGTPSHEVWYREQEAALLPHQLNYFAPRTPAEALAGDMTSAFVDIALWDRAFDPKLPPLVPGDGTAIVVSLDAGVTGDLFAATAISRHPDRPQDPAVRAARTWTPPRGGAINYGDNEDDGEPGVERWLRFLCLGGCAAGHPNPPGGKRSAVEGCDACAGAERVPAHRVVQICFDPYQLHDMMQRLSRDRVAWCEPFNQGGERLESDTDLRGFLLQGRLSHYEDPGGADHQMRDHFRNARAKISQEKEQESRLRIIKASASAKVDLAVSISMGVARCLYLNLGPRS